MCALPASHPQLHACARSPAAVHLTLPLLLRHRDATYYINNKCAPSAQHRSADGRDRCGRACMRIHDRAHMHLVTHPKKKSNPNTPCFAFGSPFKKPPRSNTQLKWSIGVLWPRSSFRGMQGVCHLKLTCGTCTHDGAGVLFLLGAFAFWVMDHGPRAYEAQLNSMSEPKRQLVPLQAAPVKPQGGGMIGQSQNASQPVDNRTATAAPVA
jgi:hypothetical protein